MTERACRRLGWDYAVWDVIDPLVAGNLRWLAGYRLPRCMDEPTAETIPSYAHRQAQANNLPTTAILRTLGDLSPGSGRQLLTMDGILNRPAQDRLETLTQISRSQLIQSLPALTRPSDHARSHPADHRHQDLPTTPPTAGLPTPHRTIPTCSTDGTFAPNSSAPTFSPRSAWSPCPRSSR